MKCSKTIRLLQAYLDNELSASKEKCLEHHLKGCALCRLELAAFKKTSEAMDSLKGIDPHRNLVSPVMDILRHEQEAPSLVEQFVRLVTQNKRKILAVGVNLIIFAVLVLRIPVFFNQPGKPDQAKMFKLVEGRLKPRVNYSTIPLEDFPVYESYDPVDMVADINDMVDRYNLTPVEKDMIVDNFINDANGFIEANNKNNVPYGTTEVRSFRVINTYLSKDGKVQKQVIIIQGTNRETPE